MRFLASCVPALILFLMLTGCGKSTVETTVGERVKILFNDLQELQAAYGNTLQMKLMDYITLPD